jgi:hypothetical protein
MDTPSTDPIHTMLNELAADLPSAPSPHLGLVPFPETPLPGRLPDGCDEITVLHQLMVRADSPFALKEFRLSSSDPETCFRRQVYPFHLGHAGTPPPIQVQRIMASGHVFEAWLVQLFAQRYPTVETQRVVPVPHLRASGHLDVFFPETAHLIEIKYVDVDELHELPKRAHLYQVQAYRHFDRQIKTSHLLYGVRGSCELVPFEIRPNPEIGQEIERNLRMMNDHVDNGTLPDRVTTNPLDFPCTYHKTDFSGTYTVHCPFYHECWQQEPAQAPTSSDPPTTRITQDQLHDLTRLIQIERGMTDINRRIKAVKAERDRLRDRIAAILPPKTPLHYQGHIIQRTVSEPTIRYDIEKAILAGVVTKEALAPFQSYGEPRERWTVKPAPSTITITHDTHTRTISRF